MKYTDEQKAAMIADMTRAEKLALRNWNKPSLGSNRQGRIASNLPTWADVEDEFVGEVHKSVLAAAKAKVAGRKASAAKKPTVVKTAVVT